MNELIDQCGRIVRLPVNQEYERYLAIKNGEEVNMFPVHEYWLDVGRIEDISRAASEFKSIFE